MTGSISPFTDSSSRKTHAIDFNIRHEHFNIRHERMILNEKGVHQLAYDHSKNWRKSVSLHHPLSHGDLGRDISHCSWVQVHVHRTPPAGHSALSQIHSPLKWVKSLIFLVLILWDSLWSNQWEFDEAAVSLGCSKFARGTSKWCISCGIDCSALNVHQKKKHHF